MKNGILIAAIAAFGGLALYLVWPGGGTATRDEHGHHEEHAHEDDHDAHGETVTLPADAAARAGIETAAAGPATVRRVVRLPGDIQLDPERVVHVVPRVSGVVHSVAKGLGDAVAAGELLAVIDSIELADARSALLAARERLGLARTRHEREQRLFEDQISSEEDFLSAKEALANAEIDARTAEQKLISLGVPADSSLNRNSEGAAPLTAYPIYSSIDGVVIAKHITHGEAVVPDSDIYLLADLTSVWAEVVVYAQDLRRVRVGQSVTIRSEDLDKSTEGTISYIGPLLGEETRTARAIVEVPNPDRDWSPGLFVTVEIVEAESPVDVAVAVDAIQTYEDSEVVFVKHGDAYEVRRLVLGQRDEAFVEVLDGLEVGEVYVTKNSYVLKADLGKAGAGHEH